MQLAVSFLSIYITSFLLDMCWLGFIAKDIYKDAIFGLMRKSGDVATPHWPAALLVYFAISFGICFFVLNKAGNSYLHGALCGALFGAVVYGVYDFTNFAVLANWPFYLSLIDLVWGMVLCGLSAMVGVAVHNWF
jgi:uncharacterized membrane protein